MVPCRTASVSVRRPSSARVQLIVHPFSLCSLGLAADKSWKALGAQVQQLREQKGLDHVFAVHFIRHAEGLSQHSVPHSAHLACAGIHNQKEREIGGEAWNAYEAMNPLYTDAKLNDIGRKQALALQKAVDAALADGLKVCCGLCSPICW